MTEHSQRPKSVIRAIYSFVFAVIIGVIYNVYGYIILRIPYGIGLSNVLNVVVPHILLLILIQQIYNGNNWSRLLHFAIFILLYMAPPILDMSEGYKYNTLGLVKTVAQNLTILIGIYFVFSKEANIWFRAIKVKRGLTTG